jgi:hypothetical protein
MPVRAVDDKASDTLVVVPGEGFWTGSSTLPHLHQYATFGASAPGAVGGVEQSIRVAVGHLTVRYESGHVIVRIKNPFCRSL